MSICNEVSALLQDFEVATAMCLFSEVLLMNSPAVKPRMPSTARVHHLS